MPGFGAIGEFAIGQVGVQTAEFIGPDKWLVAFSEPVRFKRGLSPIQQQTFAFQPTPIINIGWFEPLSEPVRYKKGLGSRYQQFAALTNLRPFVSFGWFEPLSEPVRFKRRLPEGMQQFMVTDLLPLILMNWFSPLSEPVRIKRGLRKELQTTLARGEFIPTSYTAQLIAIETRDFFLGVLYQFNIPVSAYVDIIENDPRHLGNVGVIENTARAAIVSEPQIIVAGARVAIITQ